jgi:hypothetical protein
MNRILISIIISVAIVSCTGRGRGPLVKASFEENSETSMPAMMSDFAPGRPVIDKIDAKVEPCADCITIGKLISNKKDFAGKAISVKGIVTKVNEEIMDRNWVHIQDGTEADGVFDFTITTSQNVKTGDLVTFNGVIAIDKDFGYGYAYDIIMESAQIVK